MNRSVILLLFIFLFACKLYNPFIEPDYDIVTIYEVINTPTPTQAPTPTPTRAPTPTPAPIGNIIIKYENIIIPNGTVDYNLGTLNMEIAVTKDYTFTLFNNGAAELYLTNSPFVAVTGTRFILTGDAFSPIGPEGESSYITIRFSPDGVGLYEGTVSIATSDPDDSTYSFSFQVEVISGSRNFYDQFNSDTYTGNDGSLNWSGDWQETGEADGAQGGIFYASGGKLYVSGPYSEAVYPLNFSLTREFDCSRYSTATLNYNYKRVSLDVRPVPGSDQLSAILMQISGDGGSTWQTLHTLTNGSDGAEESASYDISAYMSVNTKIRITTDSSGYIAGSIYFKQPEIIIF